MKTRQPHSHTRETFNVLGSKVTILLRGSDSNGMLSIVEVLDDPGSGPPAHIHQREDETFYVLEGAYDLMLAGETLKLETGATFFAPRDVPHSFRCTGNSPGRLLVTMSPAGFEGFFEEVGALSPQQQQPPQVIEIGKKYGLEFLQPGTA